MCNERTDFELTNFIEVVIKHKAREFSTKQTPISFWYRFHVTVYRKKSR
jgi:hypothetical protein